MRVIRAQLEGPDAELGQIQAADVARLIVNLEAAIARAAYLVLGQARRGTGRHRRAIESAARLRFIGVEQGSFVGVLALPDDSAPSDDQLPVTIADLGSQAFDRLLDVIAGDGDDIEPELADAVARMAVELGIGERHTSLVLVGERAGFGGSSTRRAKVDTGTRQRMLELRVRRPRSTDETLVGVLVEADFESNTARLRLSEGTAILVNFSPDLADDIQEALRSRAGFEGVVRYDPRTSLAMSVELRSIVRPAQLMLADEGFWQAKTFAELRAEQGTTGRVDIAALAIPDLTDEDRAAFLSEFVESHRRTSQTGLCSSTPT